MSGSSNLSLQISAGYFLKEIYNRCGMQAENKDSYRKKYTKAPASSIRIPGFLRNVQLLLLIREKGPDNDREHIDGR